MMRQENRADAMASGTRGRPNSTLPGGEVVHRDYQDHIYYPYEPTYACPDDTYAGTYGDGIKWICGIRDLTEACVVYSFGSGPDGQFELAMLAQTQCEVHVFDPTIRAGHITLNDPRMRFHNFGVAGKDGVMMLQNHGGGPHFPRDALTLPTIMRRLNHTFVDVLKMDIEGSEVAVIDHAHKTWGQVFPFGQMQIEVHEMRGGGPKKPQLYRMMDQIEQRGFHIFHKEANVHHAGIFAICEYAWVRVDLRCLGKRAVHVSYPWAKLLPKDCEVRAVTEVAV